MALVSAKIRIYQKDKTNCFRNHFYLAGNINIKSINASSTTLIDNTLNSTVLFSKYVENCRKKIKLSESDLFGLEFSIGGVNKNKTLSSGYFMQKNK
ncbi:TPA: hypothetical protein ACP5TM_004584 [Vibrio parahaemolyticus]